MNSNGIYGANGPNQYPGTNYAQMDAAGSQANSGGSSAFVSGTTSNPVYQKAQYPVLMNQPKKVPQQPNLVTNQTQEINPGEVTSPPIVTPYIPTVRQYQHNNQPYFLLPNDEVKKMLQQNANIIRKFITDVQKGKLIDLTEYHGLHASVYLLSLFTKAKVPNTRPSIPVSTYQSLIRKLKQVEMISQKQQKK